MGDTTQSIEGSTSRYLDKKQAMIYTVVLLTSALLMEEVEFLFGGLSPSNQPIPEWRISFTIAMATIVILLLLYLGTQHYIKKALYPSNTLWIGYILLP